MVPAIERSKGELNWPAKVPGPPQEVTGKQQEELGVQVGVGVKVLVWLKADRAQRKNKKANKNKVLLCTLALIGSPEFQMTLVSHERVESTSAPLEAVRSGSFFIIPKDRKFHLIIVHHETPADIGRNRTRDSETPLLI